MPPRYQLRLGSTLDQALLLRTMARTYEELYPHHHFGHLAETVRAYLSPQTPLWWLELNEESPAAPAATRFTLAGHRPRSPTVVGCLWMGTAVDQVSGLRHAHVFLLYVAPEHRRQGLGKYLMEQAEAWARRRGDRQISLQVFHHNQAALSLYQNLGYQPQSLALVKPLFQPEDGDRPADSPANPFASPP